MSGLVSPSVRARLVDVRRQMLDMSSFWIRPEYVVDYRPILDAPVDAAGEVVEEIIWLGLRLGLGPAGSS